MRSNLDFTSLNVDERESTPAGSVAATAEAPAVDSATATAEAHAVAETPAIEDRLPPAQQSDPVMNQTPPDPVRAGDALRLFELINDPLLSFSLRGDFLLLNPAWEEILGWTIAEMRAGTIYDLVHPDDMHQTLGLIAAGRRHSARIVNFTNRFRHRDGSWRWLLWSARCDGETWYAAAKDITDRMWLERQALHDPLTLLPNRLLLMDRLHQAIARLRRSPGPVALVFVDLDRFKAVNDNLGHAVGDRLLIAISDRLREALRDNDTVARLGGDEFVVLAESLEGDAEAIAVAERVQHALEEPFRMDATEIWMSASVGVSVSHDRDADPEALLRESDVAMYRAKSAGGDTLEVFDENLRREVASRLEIEHRLHDALPRHELLVHYQPIMRLDDGRAIGCEALLRWCPPGDEPIPPSLFIPIAEEGGLFTDIGEWILQEICTLGASWQRSFPQLIISVNISSRGLCEVDLAERLQAATTLAGLPEQALCLEVNEASVLLDPERARAMLQEIKRLGFKVAFDNFGVGSTSLTMPATLPLDLIKIDPAIVRDAADEPHKRAIIAAAVALARADGIPAIAVGIETPQQRALMEELGCIAGQGSLLHRPTPPEDLTILGR